MAMGKLGIRAYISCLAMEVFQEITQKFSSWQLSMNMAFIPVLVSSDSYGMLVMLLIDWFSSLPWNWKGKMEKLKYHKVYRVYQDATVKKKKKKVLLASCGGWLTSRVLKHFILTIFCQHFHCLSGREKFLEICMLSFQKYQPPL